MRNWRFAPKLNRLFFNDGVSPANRTRRTDWGTYEKIIQISPLHQTKNNSYSYGHLLLPVQRCVAKIRDFAAFSTCFLVSGDSCLASKVSTIRVATTRLLFKIYSLQ